MSLENFFKFVFKTIKICVRDMYMLPLNNLKEMLVLAICFTVASIIMQLTVHFSFLDWRGTLVSVIILLVLMLLCKEPDQ